MDIHDVLEEERVHLNSNGVCSRSRHMSSWGSESSRSVHGDERGMLRIISPPLGKIRPRIENLITMEMVVVDGLVVGRSGRHGAIQILQGVVEMVYMQNEQTQGTLGNTMVSAHKVSIM